LLDADSPRLNDQTESTRGVTRESRDAIRNRTTRFGIAKRASNDISAAPDRGNRDCAHRKLQSLTSIVFERDHVIFVRPAPFAPAFAT
jgi:hypothetical protein